VVTPSHHFPADLLRAYAIGSASEGARLAVACHLAFCPACGSDASAHAEMMDALLRAAADNDQAPRAQARAALLANLPPQPPAPPRRNPAPPQDLPAIPAPLLRHFEGMDRVVWRRLLPGIRAIELGIGGIWRARVFSFHPGIPIPMHDHGGPEHTVVFAGGLDDAGGHLGRGDAATMMPGQAHRQRSSPGEPCIALIVNESAPRPLTLMGRVLKRLTNS
jgi:putative transcriptional regulator